MIDHFSLRVRDYARSRDFYARALAPLGVSVQMEFEGGCGMGPPGKPALWLGAGEPAPSLHFAFMAPDRAAVDGFYEAALAAGGKDNGAPGIREQYHPNYYGAFVFDPDGNNIEAVCHAPPGGTGGRPKAKRGASKSAARKSGRGSTRSAKKPSKKTRKASRR